MKEDMKADQGKLLLQITMGIDLKWILFSHIEFILDISIKQFIEVIIVSRMQYLLLVGNLIISYMNMLMVRIVNSQQ